MNLTRTIYPVGHGAFYTETIFNDKDYFNVVYDCGGSKKKIIKREINCYLDNLKDQQDKKEKNEKPKIDAVFISHFHRDHINGLLHLRSNSYIKKLYIPQLSDEVFLGEYIYNLINGDNETNELLIQLYSKEFKEIFKIKKRKTISTIFKDWRYIVYNPKILNNQEFYCFYKEFTEKFNNGNKINVINLPTIINNKININNKTNLTKLKKLYNKYFGEHNSYSMPLFSGLIKDSDYMTFKSKENKSIKTMDLNKTQNCLYTGDFNVNEKNNFDNLKIFYDNLWNTIKIIQVPHHGSKYNHNKELYSNVKEAFVSISNNNNKKTPTLQEIKNNCNLKIITEEGKTKQKYEYCICKEEKGI